MTFLLETHHPDINAEGGVRKRKSIALRDGELGLSDLPGTAVTVLDQGPHLDAQAEELGVADNGEAEL